MNIVIRVDASIQIGTGHVMRCLTLAKALKENGANIKFICRKHRGNLIDNIRGAGFAVFVLRMPLDNKYDASLVHSHWLSVTQQQDADECAFILKSIQLDWLIVDHYAIDEEWQKILSVYCKKLMVIDDLADRKHQCDILLDQTFGRKEQDYQNLVPNHCELLLGSQYILLRPEFAKWRQYSLSRRRKPEFRKLLIAMGGVDANNVTGQVLEALINCNLPVGIDVTIVLGDTAPHLKSVEQQVKIMPYKTQLKSNINNMAEIMANSDLAIGATGSTTWERCCLGLPTIQMVLANNQKLIAEVMYKIKGAIKLNIQDVGVLCSSISQAKNKLEALSHNSAQVTNGKGVFNVIDFILWK